MGPVWLGVQAAIMLATAFAAVLTLSVIELAQRRPGGGRLSVLAVGLVTWMVFRMRRTAATLAACLRGAPARRACAARWSARWRWAPGR